MQNEVEEDQDEGKLFLKHDTCFLCCAQPDTEVKHCHRELSTIL